MGPLRCALAILVALALAAPAASATEPSWIRIFTVAGAGDGPIMEGDGVPATRTTLNASDVAVMPDGSFLVAEGADVRRVSRDGAIRTVAGTDTRGFSGDGGPAIRARVHADRVAVLPDGSFLLADASGSRVREVNRDGVVTTVAGTGQEGSSGDGGPATQARMSTTDVAALPDGGFLIADRAHARVREVNRDGVVTTVAGTGQEGSSGDGGPATQARITPTAVAGLPDGGFLVAEESDVRRVSPNGTIATVAGADANVDAPPLSDHRAALGARVQPTDVVALPDGGFLIADGGQQRVFVVDRDGIVATAAGAAPAATGQAPASEDEETGGRRFASGDGGLAVRAPLRGGDWMRVAAFPDGAFLLTDSSLVRLIAGGTADRLGLALDNPRHDRVHDFRFTTRVSLSRAAFVRVSVWSGSTQVGEGTTSVAGQGWFDASAWGGFEPGVYTVLVSATTADGARTLQTRTVALGGVLLDEWAVSLAGGDDDTRVLHSRPDWTGWASRRAPARAADAGPLYRTPVCRRFTARRVDCEVQVGPDYSSEGPYTCDTVVSLVLGRDGQVHRSRYACPTRRRPRLFKAHPPKLLERDRVVDLSPL